MKRFVQGDSRTQSFLLPEALDDYVTGTGWNKRVRWRPSMP